MTGAGSDLELEFPAKPEFVRMARRAVAALARLREVPEGTAMDLELAVSEACTLAVARNADAGGGPVRVLASVRPDAVEIEVLDVGPEPVPTVSAGTAELDTESPAFERSLSLPVIRGLVDELAITPRSDGAGTSVRMVLSVQAANAGGSSA